MTAKHAVAAIAGALVVLGAWWLRPADPGRLPPLEPRGQTVRGLEVFAFGSVDARELADLAHEVHAATAGLLGVRTSAVGLRIHVFSDSASCAAYTQRATGIARSGVSFLCLGDERLVALHPGVARSSVQHEVAHDAVHRALGAVPRWFTEGIATHLEAWRWTPGGGLVPRVDSGRASQVLERATPQRELEVGGAFFTSDERPSYARSWATIAALRLVRRGALDPRHGLDPVGLDDLGVVVAEHWARPDRRLEDLLAAARAASGTEREALLALAERVVARDEPDTDPFLASPALARAVRDVSARPARRLRAAAAAVAGVSTATDWTRLSEELSREAPRLARRARDLGRRARLEQVTEADAPRDADEEPGVVTRARADLRVTLRSRSWDRAVLETLADRALDAVGELARFRGGAIESSIAVEAPGVDPGRDASVTANGWPDDPHLAEELAHALVGSLVDRVTRPPLAGWERAGASELVRGRLDPHHAGRQEHLARAAVRGRYGILESVADDRFFPVANPMARALAALRVRATRERATPAPWSATVELATESSSDDGWGGPLPPGSPHREFQLMAKRHEGSGDARELAQLLRRDGHEAAAALLDGAP